MSHTLFFGNPYFSSHEFNSPDLPLSGNKMDREFIYRLTIAREFSNIPYIITSGYRSITYNKSIGGKHDSSHTKGLAVDIKCSNSETRFKIILGLLFAGFNRIGVYKNHIHVDSDNTKHPELIWFN